MVGDIVTGGATRDAAPRVGGGGGGGGDHDAAAAHCLNCGTALIGDYCHACGQSGHVHRTIGAIGHEIAHGVLHADGKIIRTIPMLAWRPGELTRRYIDGERARFVSPMAVFLFSIFTMFMVLSILGIAAPTELPGSAQFQTSIDVAVKEKTTDRRAATAARDVLSANDPRRVVLDRQIAGIDEDLAAISAVPAAFRKPGSGNEFHSGWHRLDHGIAKWRTNPGLMLYKLQSNSYKFSWLLIPLSLPFVWLLFFWRRDIHLYDHAVFVTYSIAFMSLLMVVLTIAGALGLATWAALTIGTVVALWHVYRQLKGSYRLGRSSAVLRTIVLVVFIQIVIVLFALVLVMLGLIG